MLNNPATGFFNASEYQSAGIPWCFTGTSSATPAQHDFPNVTRSLTISNLSTTATDRIDLTFANPTGSVTRKFSIMGNQTVELPLRIKSLWVTAGAGTPQYSICAALTTIPRHMMPPLLSGSWEGV